MTRLHALRFLALVTLVIVLASCGDDGTIEVIDARFRITPNDLGAGYLTITNSTQPLMVRRGKKKREPLWDTRGRPFLMGLVSVEWLARVSTLGLGATLVGLECWYRA